MNFIVIRDLFLRRFVVRWFPFFRGCDSPCAVRCTSYRGSRRCGGIMTRRCATGRSRARRKGNSIRRLYNGRFLCPIVIIRSLRRITRRFNIRRERKGFRRFSRRIKCRKSVSTRTSVRRCPSTSGVRANTTCNRCRLSRRSRMGSSRVLVNGACVCSNLYGGERGGL